MLQAELERREPELPAALNRRAAAWCNANGQPEAAIEYSVAAGDTDEVATLVGALAGTYYRSGRVTTVERWLAHFDDSDLLERYPAIAVSGAWVHALRGRPEAAERWALAVETAQFEGPMPDGSPLEAWAATVRALLCRDGVEQMQVDAELALSRLPATSQWHPVSVLMHGMADAVLRGDSTKRRSSWVRLRRRPSPEERPGPGVVARSERALLALERGDLAAAESELALAGAFVDDVPSTDYVVTAILLAVTARLEVAKRQGARARMTLVAAHRTRPLLTHALPWFSVHARLELAKAHLALSDASGAATLSREADEILRRRPALGTLVAEAERGTSKTLDGRRPVVGLGIHADNGRASPTAAADDPPLVPGDRRAAVRLPQHRQDPGDLGLPEARCVQSERGDRTGDRARVGRRSVCIQRRHHPLGVMYPDAAGCPMRATVRGGVQAHTSEARGPRRSLHRRAAERRARKCDAGRNRSCGRTPCSGSQL